MREIKKFATKMMGTADVRIDANLNKFVWSKGVRNVPFRVRVRLARKVAEDEEAAEKVRVAYGGCRASGWLWAVLRRQVRLPTVACCAYASPAVPTLTCRLPPSLPQQLYTLVTHEPVKSFKGLENVTVEDVDEAAAEA